MKNFFILIYFLLTFTFVEANTLIRGQLVNASHDSAAIAGYPVSLQKMTEQSHVPEMVSDTQTDQRGFFDFTATITDSVSYFISTDFQDVRYFSDAINSKQNLQQIVALTVYDSTHSTSSVSGLMHHLIIDDLGQTLQFRETQVLQNSSNKTITQAISDDHVDAALFKFSIPTIAISFQPLSSRTAGEFEQHGHFVYDKGIFLPGNKTISYAYEIPLQRKTVAISITPVHNTRTFDIFLSNENIIIESDQLVNHGPFNIRGTQYFRYGIENANAGTPIRFSLSRSKSSSLSPYFTIILTALFLGLALSYGLIKNKKIPKDKVESNHKELQRKKGKLLSEIAQLDVDLEKNPSEGKRNSRKELFDQLKIIEIELSNRSLKERPVKKK